MMGKASFHGDDHWWLNHIFLRRSSPKGLSSYLDDKGLDLQMRNKNLLELHTLDPTCSGPTITTYLLNLINGSSHRTSPYPPDSLVSVSNWHLKWHTPNQTLHLLLKPAPPTDFSCLHWWQTHLTSFLTPNLGVIFGVFFCLSYPSSANPVISTFNYIQNLSTAFHFFHPSSTLTGTTIVSHLNYCEGIQYACPWSTVKPAVRASGIKCQSHYVMPHPKSSLKTSQSPYGLPHSPVSSGPSTLGCNLLLLLIPRHSSSTGLPAFYGTHQT